MNKEKLELKEKLGIKKVLLPIKEQIVTVGVPEKLMNVMIENAENQVLTDLKDDEVNLAHKYFNSRIPYLIENSISDVVKEFYKLLDDIINKK